MPQTTISLFPAEIDIPRDLDLEEVACEYESYGHHVERDAHHHRLAIVWAPSV